MRHRQRGSGRTNLVCILVLLGFVALPLQAAGTIEIVYTVTPSYVLFAFAIVVGAAEVRRGFCLLPDCLKVALGSLVVVYLATLFLGDYRTVAAQARGGTLRALVYTAYIIFGVALVCLITGIKDRRFLTRAGAALILGGMLAAVYGIWSWFGLHYGLGYSDINNGVNSDGYTYGHLSQGPGLFGWERVRSTFTEPIEFGAFLTVPVLIAIPYAIVQRGLMRAVTLASVTAMLAALALTDSSISAAALLLGVATAVVVWSLDRGAFKTIAASTAAAVAATAIVGILMFDPAPLARLTGRTPASLSVSLSDRTSAWSDAAAIWATRPITGYGPGQAAARMARQPDQSRLPGAPVTLRSAQGLVMSSLVDVGVIGLTAWIGVFVAAVGTGFAAARRRGGIWGAALAGAFTAGYLATAVNGDRVDLRVWLVLSLLSLATTSVSEPDSGRPDRSAE